MHTSKLLLKQDPHTKVEIYESHPFWDAFGVFIRFGMIHPKRDADLDLMHANAAERCSAHYIM